MHHPHVASMHCCHHRDLFDSSRYSFNCCDVRNAINAQLDVKANSTWPNTFRFPNLIYQCYVYKVPKTSRRRQPRTPKPTPSYQLVWHWELETSYAPSRLFCPPLLAMISQQKLQETERSWCHEKTLEGKSRKICHRRHHFPQSTFSSSSSSSFSAGTISSVIYQGVHNLAEILSSRYNWIDAVLEPVVIIIIIIYWGWLVVWTKWSSSFSPSTFFSYLLV